LPLMESEIEQGDRSILCVHAWQVVATWSMDVSSAPTGYRSHPSPPSARRNATKDWSPSTSSHTHARHTHEKGPDEPRRRWTYYVRSCSPWSKRSHQITQEFDDHSSCRPDVMPRRATCRSFQPEFMRRDITYLAPALTRPMALENI
jgi:hypothetical protein